MTLSTDMQTEVVKQQTRICLLVEIQFDSGTQYHTDAFRNIPWGGNTYINGQLKSVNGINESLPLTTKKVTVLLSGVDQANLATALLENFVDRKIVIYRALLDANDQVIADPEPISVCYIDHPTFKETPGGSADLTWHAASVFVHFEKVSGRRTTNEDQQIHFPGDLFFDFPSVDSGEVPWGRPD